MGKESQESDSAITDSEILGEDASANLKEDKKKHKCTYDGCTAVFLRPNRLVAHLRVHTGEKPFKCNEAGCEKAYTNNSHLQRHIRTHTTTTVKVKCPDCSIMFANRQNLKRHFDRVHKDPDKLMCKLCKRSFTKRHQLQSHMAMHDDIEYKCEICNKKFLNVRSFKRHKSDHGTNARKHSCTECNEGFPKWKQLQEHVKEKHPRAYECNKCGRVFQRKWRLKRHQDHHFQGESLIPCPFDGCVRLYMRKGSLDQHIKFHHLGIGFECDICKAVICTKAKLALHIRTIHMSERKPRLKKKPRRRKDAGVPKKSMISQLVGVTFPVDFEKTLLSRDSSVQYDPMESKYTVKPTVEVVA